MGKAYLFPKSPSVGLQTSKFGLMIWVMFNQLAYVKDRLAAVGYRGWSDVAKGSGVPLSTIKKVGYGTTKHARSDTIGKLALYFQTKQRRRAA